MTNKKTPIQKAISKTKRDIIFYKYHADQQQLSGKGYDIVVNALEHQLSHLQSLLDEERRMVESALNDLVYNTPEDYFNKNYTEL